LIGSASCGIPTTYYYDDEREMKEAPDGCSRGAYYVKADGDSMLPDIKNGMLILCDPEQEVVSGNIVHFEWDGEHGVKKYLDVNGQTVLQALNSDYPPLFVTDAYELKMVRCVYFMGNL
jgi:SOS-response transcriptional repressor LexA